MRGGDSSGRVNCFPLCLAHSGKFCQENQRPSLERLAPLCTDISWRGKCVVLGEELDLSSLELFLHIRHLDSDYNGAKNLLKIRMLHHYVIHV